MEPRRIVNGVITDLVDLSWQHIRKNQVARDRVEEKVERDKEEAGNIAAENATRSREEEKLMRADIEAVLRMQDEIMTRLREQEKSAPDEGDPQAAKSWTEGPTAQGWVLERIIDAVLDNDANTIAKLLADLRSNDRNEKASRPEPTERDRLSSIRLQGQGA